MKFANDQLNNLRSIFRQHKAAAAYIFGSYARGTSGKQSDVDIAVLFEDKAASFKESLRQQHNLSSSLQKIFSREVDLVDLMDVTSPVLKHRAVIRGRLIYSGNDRMRHKLERHVLHEYEDTQYLRDIQNKIMQRQIKDGAFGKPLISSFAKQKH